MSHLPDSGQEEIVGVPLDREVAEILERLRGTRRIEVAGEAVAPEHLEDLEITSAAHVIFRVES